MQRDATIRDKLYENLVFFPPLLAFLSTPPSSSSWRTSELSIRCAPSGKNQRNPRRDPARQSYALFMRIAKCTRASQIRIYYCYSPSIRAVKSAPVFRGSCELIIGWLWRRIGASSFPSSEYISRFASSIGRKKDGNGKNKGRENCRVQIES